MNLIYLVIPSDGKEYFLEEFPLQRCWQADLGYERAIGRFVTAASDLYVKYYDREYAFMSPEQHDYRWSYEDFPGLHAGKPNGGKRAAGAELTVRLEHDPITCGIAASLSSISSLFTDGHWYADRNDVRGTLHLLLGTVLGRYHHLSASFSITGGRPYNDELYPPAGEYFIKRLPPLFLLNARYEFVYPGKRMLFGIYIDMLNILNQTPVVYRSWDSGMLTDRRMDGFVPVGGVRVCF